MIDMPTINSIRQQRRDGYSVSEIARMNGVSRDTVYKYLREDDFSPRPPAGKRAASKLDPYKPAIDQWLEDDSRNWRKQRHTARRIWQRLVEELGADVSESTVARYVKLRRAEMRGAASQFLDLVWDPGQAQADFGEADFYVMGIRRRLSFFVLTFPYSNVGLAQAFPGENAECVCQALKNIFEYAEGVPSRIVFDNATGVGRRVCGGVRTTELFGRFAAHYGFSYSFCNPNAGHEKGSVENKVGFVRRSLFVPLPQITDMDAFNGRLLGKCMSLSEKGHWAKGEDELRLFAEDRVALLGLPEHPFEVVRYTAAKADKKGKIQVDGPHRYSTDPALAGRVLTVALGATALKVFDEDGSPVCRHERAYGSAPTDTTDPASQLHLLCIKPGGWRNSRVRASLGEEVRAHMDSLGSESLKAELRLMRDEAARSGWEATSQAVELAYASTRRIDSASVAVSAARIASGAGAIAYDDPVDLGVYDGVFNGKGAWAHGLPEAGGDCAGQVPHALHVLLQRHDRRVPGGRDGRPDIGRGRHDRP